MTVKVKVKKSQWGWTAVLDGKEIAHSANRALLDGYLRDCVPPDEEAK